MTVIEINNRKLGLVEVPEDAKGLGIQGNALLYYTTNGVDINKIATNYLPPGDYTIIGKASEIDDKEILEQVKAHNLNPETTLAVKIN